MIEKISGGLLDLNFPAVLPHVGDSNEKEKKKN